MSDELKKLMEQAHDGITTFDFDGKETPCILIEEKKYDGMLAKVAGPCKYDLFQVSKLPQQRGLLPICQPAE